MGLNAFSSDHLHLVQSQQGCISGAEAGVQTLVLVASPAPPTLPSSVCLHHRPASSLSSQPPWCGGKNPSFRIRKKKTKNQKPELKFWFYPGCDFGQVIYLTSWCLSSMGTHITLPLTPWSMGRIRADDSEAGGPPKLLPG